MISLRLSIIFLFGLLTLRAQDTNSLGMKLQFIEGGRFLRGTDARERGLEQAFPLSVGGQYFGNSEYPKHVTWITRPYWIAECEVTVAQWKSFVADTGYVTTAEKSGLGIVGWSPTPADKPLYRSHDFERKAEFNWRNPGFEQSDTHPVVGVSFRDVQAFLKWLSQKEGATYRLPTEAEWEFACRAGSDTWFSFGDQPRDTIHRFGNVGNVELEKHRKHSVERQWLLDWDTAPEDGNIFTAPVGSYQANDFGIKDMHGNVWEWCADLWLDTYYKRFDWPKRGEPRKIAVDPVNHSEPQTDTNQFRSIRGGCWYNGPVICRTANRTYWDEPDAACYLGFRVVKEADPASSTKARQGYEKEMAAREAIQKAGGTFYASRGLNLEVRFEGSNPFDPEVCHQFAKIPDIETLSLSGKGSNQLSTAHLEAIARVSSMKRLIFRSSFQLREADLSVLAQAPNLEVLEISRSDSISDSDLAKLSGLRHLKQFTCYGVAGGLTDAGASHLKGNRNLEILNLRECEVTGSFLADLKGCPLQTLSITTVNNRDTCLTDTNTVHLVDFPELKSLHLGGHHLLSDSTVKTIGKLQRLESLNLDGCSGISPQGFAPLGGLQRLDSLSLRETSAADAAVAELVKIPRLEQLRLGSENLTDAGFKQLAKIFSLKDLSIYQSSATGEGLKALGRINRLERLDLASEKIDGRGLGPVVNLPNLKDIKLRCPALTDIAFEHLSRGKELRKIRLVERGVKPPAALTDEGIMKMASATWLSELWLPRNDTSITEQGIADLQKQMPKTRVIPYTVDWKKR